ncbi:hypothetical protein [Desulfotruncus alcoholivorax]|uniref:hypothetical protein n=1 Tax=Desulfotruncus alcoholivorax TaxID=265477 RepID=UPI0003F795E6|nr:hypothetical protein [Desulfotruncus alcoholivorax]
MQIIIKVDIVTGQVLENNLREFWVCQGMCSYLPDPVWCHNPAFHSQTLDKKPVPQLDDGLEQALRYRVKKFNGSWRQRKNKHAWSDADIFQLAVLMGLENKKPQHAAVRLARSPRACQSMFMKLKQAGVI